MDEGMLLALASRRTRRIIRRVVVVLFVFLLAFNHQAVASVAMARGAWVAERYQAAIERLLSDTSVEPVEPTPVAPGKLRQLRRDMRHR